MEYKVGDRVRVYGLNELGTIINIDVIEDDDGEDDEGRPIIRKVTFYDIKLDKGNTMSLRHNFEKI